MKALVKIGGTLLDTPESRQRLAAESTEVSRQGHRLVVVHGGGKQMTRFLEERGVESRFVNGLRVTTPQILDAVLKVFAGTVNHELVSALVAAGCPAVGLTGIDASLTEAEQMDPALGAVGRLVQTNPRLLEVLIEGGFLPVVACVAGDRRGNIYNVNADQMAAGCAVAYGARALIFLTDVAGVLDAGKRVLPELTLSQADDMISEGVATGGMQAKLIAAKEALQAGVAEVIIAAGKVPGAIGRIISGQGEGTRLIRSAATGSVAPAGAGAGLSEK